MIWRKKKKEFDHLVNVPLNEMYVFIVIIIIYWWCTSSMIYELNFCYMLKGIQESNFCNNIQGFQCHFSQPIGQCWMLIFFFFFFNFLNPLRILLPYPQTAMNLHKSEQICYIYLQSNIVVSHHRIHLLPPRLKCSTFNVSIITIQRFYNHCNKLKKKVALNFPRLYFTQYVTCAVWLFVNVNVVACISR